MPRGVGERHAGDILDAIRRGEAVSEADLPKFPRAPRWDKDTDFDARVSALRTVRDAAAHRLELDPGVLCSRERLEAIARKAPKSVAELEEMPELRKWQVAELGSAAVKALGGIKSAPPVRVSVVPAPASAPATESTRPLGDRTRSPYREE
jgi:ribonuclease D